MRPERVERRIEALQVLVDSKTLSDVNSALCCEFVPGDEKGNYTCVVGKEVFEALRDGVCHFVFGHVEISEFVVVAGGVEDYFGAGVAHEVSFEVDLF